MNAPVLFLALTMFSAPAFAFSPMAAASVAYLLPLLTFLFKSKSKKASAVKLLAALILGISLVFTSFTNNSLLMSSTLSKPLYGLMGHSTPDANFFEGSYEDIARSQFFTLIDTPKSISRSDRIIGYNELNPLLEASKSGPVYITSDNWTYTKLLQNAPEYLKESLFLVSPFIIEQHALEKSKKISFPESEIPLSLIERITNTHAYNSSKLNVITLVDSSEFSPTTSSNSLFVNARHLLHYNPDEMAKLKSYTTEEKQTVIVNNLARSSEEFFRSSSKLLANKLELKKVSFIEDRDKLLSFSLRKHDAISSLTFPGFDRYISPSEFYAHHSSDNSLLNSSVICFSEECMKRFGKLAINAFSEKIVTFDFHPILNIQSLDRNKDIFISTDTIQNGYLAKKIGYELYKNNYDLDGYLYSHSLYMSETKVRPEYNRIDTTSIPMLASIALHSLNQDSDSYKLYLSESKMFLIGLLLGVIFSLNLSPKLLPFSVLSIIGASFFVELNLDDINSPIISPEIMIYSCFLYYAVTLRKESSSLIVIVAFAILYGIGTLKIDSAMAILIFSHGLGTAISKLIPQNTGSNNSGGSKYTLTSPLLPSSMKGVPVSTISEVFENLKDKKRYLLRSDHKNTSEITEGGRFESIPVTINTSRKTIENLFSSDLEAVSRENLSYWLMPYIDYKKKGAAESLSVRRGAFKYSLALNDVVTEGLSSRELLGSRIKPENKEEKEILKSLKKAESSIGCPVHIEIGVRHNGKVDILQVRPLSYFMVEHWEICNSEFFMIDPLSSSISGEEALYNLTNGAIISGIGGTYSKETGASHLSKSDYLLISMIPDFISKKHPTGNFSEVIGYAKSVFSPLFSKLSKGVESKEISNNFEREIFYSKLDGKLEEILISYDVGGPIINQGSNKIFRSTNERDLLNIAITFILSWIRRESLDLEIEDIETASNQSKPIVVVKGDFSGIKVSLSEFLNLPIEERKNFVIYDRQIPVSMTNVALESKAVIIKVGTTMSHFCLTAKSRRHPCKIQP